MSIRRRGPVWRGGPTRLPGVAGISQIGATAANAGYYDLLTLAMSGAVARGDLALAVVVGTTPTCSLGAVTNITGTNVFFAVSSESVAGYTWSIPPAMFTAAAAITLRGVDLSQLTSLNFASPSSSLTTNRPGSLIVLSGVSGSGDVGLSQANPGYATLAAPSWHAAALLAARYNLPQGHATGALTVANATATAAVEIPALAA